ncbi:MAG: sigma-54 dependent transcriptional regulator [Gammaproteobacteria bacterium]|nr:sigma-54 dependent transcriptional regulator [Gammaproteobacteria bacterium]
MISMKQTGQSNWLGSRNILCVDPSSTTSTLRGELETVGWTVSVAGDASDLRRHIEVGKYHLGLLVFKDPGFAEDVLAVDPQIHWIALVDDEMLMREETQVLLSRHFYDYHRLPVDVERLTTTLGHASGIARLRLLHNSQRRLGTDDGLIGHSKGMKEVRKQVAQIAGKDFPVLITGESGTGKELIARSIHDQSKRSCAPFVAVNCGAIPPALIQSELFGHEKGAFTGADKRRLGRFEAASGGTLFLDEIGDLSLDLQVNLLRVLEESVIERVGDHRSVTVDTRIIAATNVDMKEALRESRFREDLYYRLNVFQIDVPPLRDRGDDVLTLAETFLSELNEGSEKRSLSSRAKRAMRAYTWPGNVRELMNRIKSAHVSCESRVILPNHLGLESCETKDADTGPTLEEARRQVEKKVLASALSRNTNNLSKVARELAVSRVTLYRLLKKHDFESLNG